jgi:hypothetical protein
MEKTENELARMTETKRQQGRYKREETEKGRKKIITKEENEILEDTQKAITGTG